MNGIEEKRKQLQKNETIETANKIKSKSFVNIDKIYKLLGTTKVGEEGEREREREGTAGRQIRAMRKG